MVIKYICAWCGRELRPPTWEAKGDDKVVISHGICKSCAEKVRKGLKKEEERYE